MRVPDSPARPIVPALPSPPDHSLSERLLSERLLSARLLCEPTLAQFKRRALALHIPGFDQTKRLADVFCTPMSGTRLRAHRAKLEPFRSQTLDLNAHQPRNGQQLQAYIAGDPTTQPYVLCSHGWSSFGARFAPWCESLNRAGFAVVSFDHFGHGLSSGSLATFPSFIAGVNAIRDHFGEPTIAIGHSFGAAALACCAGGEGLRAPLILIAPPADLRVAMACFIRRVRLAEHQVERLASELSRRFGHDARNYRANQFANQISQPVLIVHDFADDEVSYGAGLQYALLAPRARILGTQDLGHHKVLTDQAVIDAGMQFISGKPVGEKLAANGLDLHFCGF